MTLQAAETGTQHSMREVTSPPRGQHNMYQYMYSSPKRPSGFFMSLRSKVEMVAIYTWVLIQTLFLIAGLTVLHFSTFSVMVVYLVNGIIKGRRELLPQK